MPWDHLFVAGNCDFSMFVANQSPYLPKNINLHVLNQTVYSSPENRYGKLVFPQDKDYDAACSFKTNTSHDLSQAFVDFYGFYRFVYVS
jgi:hypothetical protein